MHLFLIAAAILIAAAAVLAAGLIPGLLITIAVGLAVLLIWMLAGQHWTHLGDVGQGLLGFASVIALIVGALLYYQAGRHRARIEARATATIVPLPHDADGTPRILVQVAGTVTNRGESRRTFGCVAVDVRGFRMASNIDRNGVFHYDMNTEPLLTETASGTQWETCVGEERRRWESRESDRLSRLKLPEQERRPFHPPNSGHRYEPFELLSGESQTLDLELVVPCVYGALRLHFLVPRPDADAAHEAKTVLAIDEYCRRSRVSSTGGGLSSGGGW